MRIEQEKIGAWSLAHVEKAGEELHDDANDAPSSWVYARAVRASQAALHRWGMHSHLYPVTQQNMRFASI